jgi:hypothetical protein
LVITQEWLAEAMAMWFIAGVVVIVTVAGGSGHSSTDWVYRATANILFSLPALTAFPGARTPVIFLQDLSDPAHRHGGPAPRRQLTVRVELAGSPPHSNARTSRHGEPPVIESS